MNIEQTAADIIKRFGKDKGIEFIQFVLSSEFGLQKRTTKIFWKEVLEILNYEKKVAWKKMNAL